MSQSQFSLSWESYKSNICSGLSSLQQNGEFVDMTIAADGHFVKVHQVIVALSSPYIKELISSAPCQHPVVFLNNISHPTLCLILEYIYTGEVLVPSTNLASFIEAAKALHIKGLESVDADSTDQRATLGSNDLNTRGIKRKFNEQISLPTSARRVFIKHESDPITTSRSARRSSNISDDIHSCSLVDDGDGQEVDDTEGRPAHEPDKRAPSKDQSMANLQFTVSIRGSLQVILNRYMYNLQSTQASGVRRWRCIDYRNKKCMAFLVTLGNVVMNRANPHNHAFHDQKILRKIEKNAVYSAIDDVEGYKEKDSKTDNETSASNDYVTFETELQDVAEDAEDAEDAEKTDKIIL